MNAERERDATVELEGRLRAALAARAATTPLTGPPPKTYLSSAAGGANRTRRWRLLASAAAVAVVLGISVAVVRSNTGEEATVVQATVSAAAPVVLPGVIRPDAFGVIDVEGYGPVTVFTTVRVASAGPLEAQCFAFRDPPGMGQVGGCGGGEGAGYATDNERTRGLMHIRVLPPEVTTAVRSTSERDQRVAVLFRTALFPFEGPELPDLSTVRFYDAHGSEVHWTPKAPWVPAPGAGVPLPRNVEEYLTTAVNEALAACLADAYSVPVPAPDPQGAVVFPEGLPTVPDPDATWFDCYRAGEQAWHDAAKTLTIEPPTDVRDENGD